VRGVEPADVHCRHNLVIRVRNWFPGGATRRRRPLGVSEDGFTLLELMVVVAIIGLIISVALPSFNAARSTAQDHTAQANLRTALVAANTAFISSTDQSFDTVTPAALVADEPSLRWSASELTTGAGTISAINGCVGSGSSCQPGDPSAIGLADDAGNGVCWYAFQADNDAPWYGAANKSGAVCDAKDAGSFASGRTLTGD